MKRKTSGAICQADTQYLPVMSFMKADIYLICKLKHFQIFKSKKNHQSCPFATELFWMAWKAQCQHHQLLSGTEARYHLSQSTKHINSDVKYWCARQSISSNPFSDVWHLAGQPQGHMHQYFELLVVKKMIKMSEHQRVVVLQAESLEEESEDLGSVLSESLLPFRWENIFKWKMELWPLVGMTGISLNKHIWGCHWNNCTMGTLMSWAKAGLLGSLDFTLWTTGNPAVLRARSILMGSLLWEGCDRNVNRWESSVPTRS